MKPSRTSAGRRASYAARNPPVQMPVDLGAFDAMISGLQEDISHALRPAAQAGAEVIYQAVLRNVDALGAVTGNLRGAIYQAFSEKGSVEVNGGYSKVRYDVSWNHRKAPHAHLIEYGHLQRYAVHLGKDGKWHTVVHHDMFDWTTDPATGKRKGTLKQAKPSRGAPQSAKDAFYVLRPGGPAQIAARPFMRPAFYRQGEAAAAVETAFWKAMNK